MNNNTHSRASALAGIALLILLGMLAVRPAAAQTWSGLGADGNWTTGANWVGGVPPPSSNTTVVAFGSSPRLASVVDVPWTVNRIDFAGRHDLSGQALTFDGAAAQLHSSFIGSVANPITLAAPLTVFTGGFGLQLSGGISGPGSLSLGGAGGVTISGVNTFTGGTTILVAVVRLAGTMVGPVTVNLAGILSGPGATVSGAVTVNDASISGGIGAPFNTGNLTISGFNEVIINGPAQGTQYSNINVTGSVVLSGATLGLNGAYVPGPGDVFTIITNDGADPVTGTFAGLPERSTIVFNGVPLRISYVGGTGNDVTLASGANGLLTQVPTLSEWALMLLAALMLGIGMYGSRRVR